MSSCPSTCKDIIRARALDLGASACGFAAAEPVDTAAAEVYDRWISRSCHATMDYCADYADVRRDPRLLLPGARTVISMAFPYYNPGPSPSGIARYAWGSDYHFVLKARMAQLAEFISAEYGGECRALVDTAPMRERYWAVKAGIGFVGLNNQLIVPGAGSWVFLAELLWTADVAPDRPCTASCGGCGACVRACPGGALDGRGGCDARRCVSYLTIEHKGDLPSGADLGGWIYGCDVCQQVCPHNRNVSPTPIAELQPSNPFVAMTPEEIASITPSQYKKRVKHSAMRRVPFAALLRNIRNLQK